MKSQSILGLSGAALVITFLFISITAFDMPKLPGSGATDVVKMIPVPGNMTVPVPPAVVASIGNGLYNFEVARREKADPKVTQKTEEIFQRLQEIALVHPTYGAVAKELKREWKLNTLEQQNPPTPAAAYPGGGIAVYHERFKVIKSEGVLASILGHEMAHLLAQHHLQRWNRDTAAALISVGQAMEAGQSLDKMDPKVIGPVAGAMGVGYLFGEEIPLQREKELEADCLGLLLAAKAGYNPGETERFLDAQDKAKKQKASDMLQFLNDHPVPKERHDHISTTCLPDAQTAFEKVPDGKRQKEPVFLPGVKEVS